MSDFLITIVIGGLIGYLFFKMKVPGGMIIGSIIGVSLLNILTGNALMPYEAKIFAQIVTGTYIGSTVEPDDLRRVGRIRGIAVILLCGLMIQNLVSGFLIYRFSSMDLITSLMSAVPGGMTNIPIISAELGADVPKVVVMQFVRLLAGIGIFPSIISFLSRNQQDGGGSLSQPDVQVKILARNGRDIVLTIGAAVIAGLIGNVLGIPAGAMLFSMLVVVALKMMKLEVTLPDWTKRLAQLLSGAYIGSGVLLSDIIEIRYLAVPVAILLIGYMVSSYIIGWSIHKFYDKSLKEAMLAATPAGATDMALIASDLGVQGSDVVVLQVMRLMAVMTVFPQTMYLIVKVFGGL